MSARVVRVAALLLSGVAVLTSHAAEPELPRSPSMERALPPAGWATWQVPAVEGAPDWCCWSGWDGRNAPRAACELDDDDYSLGNRGEATTDIVRVYARVTAGKIDRVRALSARCAVEARTPIQDLGDMTADDSARWLLGLARLDGDEARSEAAEDALAALAFHRGAVAQDALAGIARGAARSEARRKAVFWLALLRGTAGADVATAVMFEDRDADVRKHASFAITRSKSPRVAADLIRLGNTDADHDVRAQAWFWLAQTGAPGAEKALLAAIRKDDDEHVREHAVFSLSRLPDGRATRALIAVAEDRTLAREQRKRAVFWLAQSESDGAQEYLQSMLGRNAVK